MLKRRCPVLCLLIGTVLLGACGAGGEVAGSSSGSLGSASSTASTHLSSTANTHASSSAAPVTYTVVVQVSDGGQASPNQQNVLEGHQAQVELLADSGFQLAHVSGCGGTLQGEIYFTAPVWSDCQVNAEFVPSGGIAGRLLPAPYTVVDVSINDKVASIGHNNQCSQAQKIDNWAVVYGFASAKPTEDHSSAASPTESYGSSDFYRLTLAIGQTAELEVVDYLANQTNLALYLWNSDCSQKIAFSKEGGEVEQVTSFSGGDSVLEVRAEAGVSKYVLRIANAWDISDNTDDLLNFSASLPEFVPGEVIIEFDPDAGSQVHHDLSRALDRAQGLQLNFRHMQPGRATLATTASRPNTSNQLLRRPTALRDLKDINETAYHAINTLRMVDFLAKQPGVRHAEPNFILHPNLTPNDPRYGNQWHYNKIMLPQAWSVTTGARSDGHPVVIAILDTGVYLNHEDLRDKLLPGYDFHDNNDSPDELNGNQGWHGTHVAGTAAASTNNGVGVAGVSWHAQLLPVRVLGDDGGTSYDVLQGVRYAAGLSNDSGTLPLQRADVINLSLGGGGYSKTAQSLYRTLYQSGIFVVAAAGNDNTSLPMYPASYDGVFSISATDCHNNLASYSNFGPTISLAAPGGDNNSRSCGRTVSGAILSTVGGGSGSSRTSSYELRIGTSMAAPHVAGVIALMRAVFPTLTPEEFQRLLQDGAITDDLGEPGRDDKFGYGLINAAKAVQAAQTMAGQPPLWAAQVVANSDTLNLEHASTAKLELSKAGEGDAPSVLGWRSIDDWLTAVAMDVDEQGLGTYEIHINRNSFSDDERGDYRSKLFFTLEDDSELSVSVYIQVGTARDSAPIYVILLDADNRYLPRYETLAQWHNAELHFHLEAVAPGDYLLVAGSDIDGDRVICQAGEICGAFPNFAERRSIRITDEVVGNLDFSLNIVSRIRPSTDSMPEEIHRP